MKGATAITMDDALQAWRLLDRIFAVQHALRFSGQRMGRKRWQRLARLERLYDRALVRAKYFDECAFRYNRDTVLTAYRRTPSAHVTIVPDPSRSRPPG